MNKEKYKILVETYFDDEQLQCINEAANKIIESIKPFVELMTNVWQSIKEIVTEAFKELKQFLSKDVLVGTNKIKKGKKYIHSYTKIKMWRLLV